MTRDTVLLYFALKYDGDFNRIYHAIDANEQIDFADFNKLMSNVKHKYITIVDLRYPDYLKDKYNPPITGINGRFILDEDNNIKMLCEKFTFYVEIEKNNR